MLLVSCMTEEFNQPEFPKSDELDDYISEIIVDENQILSIDGEIITVNQIYDALHTTCGGTTDKVYIKFHKSVPMSILDSIENELRELDILRVTYYKF